MNRLVGKDAKDEKFLTPDSSQTESEDYSPLMQRRKKATDKEMPKFNIQMPVREEQHPENTAEKRPITPSIRKIPPHQLQESGGSGMFSDSNKKM